MKPRTNALPCLLLVAGALLGRQAGGPAFDPVTQDPPVRDAEHPALLVEAPEGLESHGARLNGILYPAAGAGPHPTVLLLHGLPGNERNTDLAQVLRRAGYDVAFFHYRGAWGSEGDFSFANCVEDARAMLAFLRTERAREAYRVDRDRLYLIGHSLGGGVALVAAALEPDVRGVVALAPADLGMLAGLPAEYEAGFAEMLEGELALRVPDGVAAFRGPEGSAERLLLTHHAAALADRPLLFVTGSADDVVDPKVYQAPLLAALEREGAGDVTTVTLEADHAFSSKRIALARTVLDWLRER